MGYNHRNDEIHDTRADASRARSLCGCAGDRRAFQREAFGQKLSYQRVTRVTHLKRLPINGINHQSGPYAASV